MAWDETVGLVVSTASTNLIKPSDTGCKISSAVNSKEKKFSNIALLGLYIVSQPLHT